MLEVTASLVLLEKSVGGPRLKSQTAQTAQNTKLIQNQNPYIFGLVSVLGHAYSRVSDRMIGRIISSWSLSDKKYDCLNHGKAKNCSEKVLI